MMKINQIDRNISIIHTEANTYLFSTSRQKLLRIDKAEELIKNIRNKEIALPTDNKKGLFEDIDDITKNKIEQYKTHRNCFIDTLVLGLTYDCNLKCRYCYEHNLDKQKSRTMDFDVGKRAIDIMLNQSERNDRMKSIVFFGGEPLIHFDLIKALIKYTESKTRTWKRKVEYSITTNLLLMTDEMFSFFDKTNTRILISIDGDEEINDRNRVFKNGTGTYKKVVDIIKRCSEKRPELLYARATITPECIDITKIVNHIRGLGIDTVYFSAEDCIKEHQRIDWNNDLIKEYNTQYGRYIQNLYSHLINGDYRINFNIYNVLLALKNEQIHVVPCQIATGTIAVSPTGQIYPCQRLIENSETVIGTVQNGIDIERAKDFFPRVVYEKHTCRDCWARFICGGSCTALSIEKTGNDLKPDIWSCKIRKIECTWILWLYIRLKEVGFPFDTLMRC